METGWKEVLGTYVAEMKDKIIRVKDDQPDVLQDSFSLV